MDASLVFLQGAPETLGAVLHILLRVIEARLCHRSGSAGGRVGVVSFEQRFGAALNAHVHFHCYVTDGVFAVGHDGQVHFDAAGALTPEDLAGDATAGARSRVALVRPCPFALLASPTRRCRPTPLLSHSKWQLSSLETQLLNVAKWPN